MRRITYRKAAAVAMAAALSAALLVGCGSTAASTDSAAASTVAGESAAESTAEDAEKTADEGDADEVAAKNCADLIDAIYVQERSADTDAQCEAAKAAWDALTDTQKELVEGENADPDYFGRDTGDAGKDDPRNADDIGENELLVVSFGTSFNGSRAADIKGIEDALQAAYPDWSVRRAFTAQIIINHVQARDGEKIDNMDQALDRAVANGVKNLVVQPTHLMHGAEYDEMCEAVEQYRDKFDSVAIAEPLLGEVGEDATVINADKEAVAAAITAEAVKTAGYDDAAAAAASLSNFQGVRRRFDLVGEACGVTVVDDYAHHPTELEATLRAAKEMDYKRVWAVFQPFTYSRTQMLLDDFARVLREADHVVLTDMTSVAYPLKETHDIAVEILDALGIGRGPEALLRAREAFSGCVRAAGASVLIERCFERRNASAHLSRCRGAGIR